MSTEQATQPAEYRVPVHVTLPLSILRRLEPYTAKRQRGAFIQAAVVAALEQREQTQQDRERAAV
jgi:metal-responsive CopG/Arc/MetJ family transcriptional regulator